MYHLKEKTKMFTYYHQVSAWRLSDRLCLIISTVLTTSIIFIPRISIHQRISYSLIFFESAPEKKFTSQFVDNRKDYYEEVKNLAADKDGFFYVVGSDEFLVQNIEVLRAQGIKPEQIMIDKREQQLPEFLSFEMSI
jgi:hypothetical protein